MSLGPKWETASVFVFHFVCSKTFSRCVFPWYFVRARARAAKYKQHLKLLLSPFLFFSRFNRQFRYEERTNEGYVKGRYGFYDKYGKLQVINYEADPIHGFHAEGAAVPKYPH